MVEDDPEKGVQIALLPLKDDSNNEDLQQDDLPSPSTQEADQEFVPELPKVWEPFPPFKRSKSLKNRLDKRWWTPLHEAVEQKDMKRVEGMGPAKWSKMLTIQDPDRGMTAVHLAVTVGSLELLKLLLEENPGLDASQIKDLKSQSFEGRSALHEACMIGHLDIVKWMCDENTWVGWNPARKNRMDCNAAFFAASYGHLDILKYLLSRSTEEEKRRLLGQRHKQKYTILHGAVYYKRLEDEDRDEEERKRAEEEKQRLIQKRNEDSALKKRENMQWSLSKLSKAMIQQAAKAEKLKSSEEAELQMKEEQSKKERENSEKQSEIDLKRLELVTFLAEEIIKLDIFDIMDKGEKIGEEIDWNSEKITALYLAAKLGHVMLVEYLLQYVKDPEIDCRNTNNVIMLHDAAEHNRVDVVRFLCEKSFFKKYIMDKENIWEAIPFSGAASGNNTEIMRMILDYGEEVGLDERTMVTYQNKYGWSSLHDTSVRGHIEATKFLCDHAHGIDIVPLKDGFGSLALHLAAMGGHNEVIELLLPLTEAASSINEKNSKNNTPLHEAASRGRTETVRMLLETPHVTLFRRGDDESSVLHEAVRSGCIKCVKEFWKFKDKRPLPLTMQTKTNGHTPLHLAISLQHTDIALMCLEMETGEGQLSAVNMRDKKGLTPLSQAAMAGNSTVVETIMERVQQIKLTPYKIERSNFNYGNYNAFGTFPWICKEGREEFFEDNHCDIEFHDIEAKDHTSPINSLIRKNPDVVVWALDKCWCRHLTNDEEIKRPTGGSSEIAGDTGDQDHGQGDVVMKRVSDYFRVIINFHMIEKYSPQRKKGKEKKIDVGDSFKTVGHRYDPEAYIEDESPLQVMARRKHVGLLTHPVVQALIDIKWANHGFFYYLASAIIKLLFVALLLGFTLKMHQDVFKDSSWNCTKTPDNETNCAIVIVSKKSNVATGLGIALMVLTTILLIAEIVDLVDDVIDKNRGFQTYLRCQLNIVEDIAYVLALSFASITVFSDEISSYKWQISALAVVSAFINVLLTLRAISFLKIGLHIIMFFKIVVTFVRSIGVLFVVFVLGFVCVFHILSAGEVKSQYSSFANWSPYYKTLSMGVSGVAYEDYDDGEEEIARQLITGYVVGLIFFAIVIQILFMNLATGLAIEDVKEIRENSKVEVNIIKIYNIYKAEQFLFKLGKYMGRDLFKLQVMGELRQFVNIPLVTFKRFL